MSSVRRIGLPSGLRMRHDTHFVDQLGKPGGESVGRMIALREIDPNPAQPRQDMGDLSELAASIREKGVIEPILVRPVGARFQIVAGERRYRAAREAGLAELPCVVREASDSETMELALIENLQRRDLTSFEEADGLKLLAEKFAYTHEMMAERLGRSRTSVTEILSLTAMPEDIRNLCRLADILSKSLLLQVVRQGDTAKMVALIERLQAGKGTRAEARRLVEQGKPPGRGRPKNFTYRFAPKAKGFSLSLQFKKPQVSRDEIIHTLESILGELRSAG